MRLCRKPMRVLTNRACACEFVNPIVTEQNKKNKILLIRIIMNVSYYQNKVNQLDKEIADLETKIAVESKIEADKSMRIINTQKSITKYTSASTVSMKMRQIEGYNREIARAQQKRADLQKKQAAKRSQRARYAIDLQRETEKESKKTLQAQKKMQEEYERKVNELTQSLNEALSAQTQTHIYEQTDDIEYDVFISHASEDKSPFVDELVKALQEKGVKVWYDSINIGWGDSLRSQIDNGLKKSTFGIVVLSEIYIKKGWTQYELEGLFNIEMTKGKTILPIWHNITKQQVMDFSPTLAGRKALTSALMTAEEIANEFVKLINDNKNDKTDN